MEITAIIKGGNYSTMKNLKARGISANFIVGGILIKLPTSKEVVGGYEIPKEVVFNGNTTFLIDCAEHGGRMNNAGSGTIVCGLSGKSLRPYRLSHEKNLACKTHAHFNIPESVVTITGFCGSTRVRIQEHTIVRDGNIAKIQTKELWDGEAKTIEWVCHHCNRTFMENPGEHTAEDGEKCYGTPVRLRIGIPHILERFQNAAMAAQEKADCDHCQHVHYADGSKWFD